MYSRTHQIQYMYCTINSNSIIKPNGGSDNYLYTICKMGLIAVGMVPMAHFRSTKQAIRYIAIAKTTHNLNLTRSQNKSWNLRDTIN